MRYTENTNWLFDLSIDIMNETLNRTYHYL